MNDFKIQYPLDLGSTHLIIIFFGGGGAWVRNFDPAGVFFRQKLVKV